MAQGTDGGTNTDTGSGGSVRMQGRPPSTSPGDVVDVAEALLADGGFDQLSVRRVAEALGTSRQVVYTHFGGMGGLLDALHIRLSERLEQATVSAAGEPGTEDHIMAAAAEYRTVARQWPELYQLVFERPVAEHNVGPDAAAISQRGFGRIVDMSEAWLRHRARGADVEPADAMRLARTIWSTTHGFVVLERVGFATVAETDSLSDAAITALLVGWPTKGPNG